MLKADHFHFLFNSRLHKEYGEEKTHYIYHPKSGALFSASTRSSEAQAMQAVSELERLAAELKEKYDDGEELAFVGATYSKHNIHVIVAATQFSSDTFWERGGQDSLAKQIAKWYVEQIYSNLLPY